jgi:excisionase family DNA binding protein
MTTLLTAAQVAEQLQVPTSWVYRAAREGTLPSVPCGRYRRFHPDDLRQWVDGHRANRMALTAQAAPAVLEHPGARHKEK